MWPADVSYAPCVVFIQFLKTAFIAKMVFENREMGVRKKHTPNSGFS